MTKNNDFKKLVRERMAKTGESYATARRQMEGERPAPTLDGWVITGPGDHNEGFELTDYAGGLELDMVYRGKPCAYLRSTVDEPNSHAVIMQSVDARPYRGERIRFSAGIRCTEGTEDADLWVRVVPLTKDWSFSAGYFKATTDWQDGAVVLDVDPLAVSIMFGVGLTGAGNVWMSNATFEVVDLSVALTSVDIPYRWPLKPVNLSFEG